MKFTVATILALASLAVAYPAVDNSAPVKRQDIVTNIDVSIPAMSDASGNVIPFDATKVYKAAAAKGL
ncbi:hypothetical protein NEMBOFW57_003888 [Staphylotrichum longicolle]|uniref:Uncharacterized protein n=1 Tax=Staphylotrichum longicolle TaxID=669026 RepID=A0AAD4F6L6_9PEZI|nr:hypothetical protein NEMBOFW57_003888 [Staphylotrichum longicolle]